MRELAKSMLSFSWAMSLFGLKQIANALAPGDAAASFDAVTRSAEGQLGQPAQSAFQAGDNLQRGVVDFTFGVLTGGLNPNRSRGDAAPQRSRPQMDPGQAGAAAPSGGVPQDAWTGQPAGGSQGGAGQESGWIAAGARPEEGGGTPGAAPSQEGGWIVGGAGPEAGGLLGGASRPGGWNLGGGGGNQAGLPLPKDVSGGWSPEGLEGVLAGDGWSMSGAPSFEAVGAGIAQEAGNLASQALGGGMDFVQQEVEAAAQALGVEPSSGTGGDQLPEPGDFQTSGGSQR